MRAGIILTITLLLLLTAYAFAQTVTIEPEYNAIGIESNGSTGITLAIANTGDEKVCLELGADSDYAELEASILASEFCLNGGESTRVALAINASQEAEEGNYTVTVNADYNGNGIESNITVNLLGLAEIELEAPSSVAICKEGYTKYIEVDAMNRGSGTEKITLLAESELFLPVFEPNTVELGGGETETVELKIHINNTTKLGEYTIPIQARTRAGLVERKVGFELIECTEKYFNLGLLDREINVDEGETEVIEFYVKSLYDEEQAIRLSAIGDLPNSMDAYEITLGGNESFYGFLTVSARETDRAGEHTITLYAWNSLGEDSEELTVDVDLENPVRVEVLNNDIEQRACSAIDFEVFEATITNNGDREREIALSIDNDYDSIGIDISDEEFTLGEGESKTVYIAVKPGYDAGLGAKTIYLIVESDGDELAEEALNFTVVETGEESFGGMVEIVNYPRTITVEQGGERTISITINNPTNETINGIRVKLWGLGNGIYFNTHYITELGANESATIGGTLGIAETADAETYNLTLEVKVGESVTTKKVTLYIETGQASAGEQENEGIGFAGLFGLAGSAGIALGLTILIVLLVIFFIYLLLSSAKNHATNA